MRHALLRYIGAITLGLSISCGSDDPVAPAALDRDYELETVNGSPLPFLVSDTPDQRVEVVSGSLTLRQNRTYSAEVQLQWTSSTATVVTSEGSAGTYTLSGNQLTFREYGSGDETAGTRDGIRINLSFSGVAFSFVEK